MQVYNAIATYRALIAAPGGPGEIHRLRLTQDLFHALGEISRLIGEVTPIVSRNLDELAQEFLHDAMRETPQSQAQEAPKGN